MSSARITRVTGAVAEAKPLGGVGLYEMVRVGARRLLGEVIRVERETATLQVFEDTTGLALGEPVEPSGDALTVELGPGLLGGILDGVGRPLGRIAEVTGDFLAPGSGGATLDPDRRWAFEPRVARGAHVAAGDVLGTVREHGTFEHRVLVPPGVAGAIAELRAGAYTVREPIGRLADGRVLSLSQRWPVREPRPIAERLSGDRPFVTGQRVFDFLFPVAEGGSVAVPGGFGTGKTVIEQSLAKYGDADVVVYIGCGERGNEMAEVLHEFPTLEDPRTGAPVMERTVLIVNTSNMPVAAREASIYLGITVAEYYRDMGYRVAVLADSLSRWAEALREIGARLQEMPGEEGYPTALSNRLGKVYERAGRAAVLGSPPRVGAVTYISAVSPPGGDFSEPVTQASLRVTGGLWALDAGLAHQRQFPAVDWETSYSLYARELAPWFDERLGLDWWALRRDTLELLQRERELREIASLVGPEALEDKDRLLLCGPHHSRCRSGAERLRPQRRVLVVGQDAPAGGAGARSLSVGRCRPGAGSGVRSHRPATVAPRAGGRTGSRTRGVGPDGDRGGADGGGPATARRAAMIPVARVYRGAVAAAGPLLYLAGTRHAALGEWARIRSPGQPERRGQVIDVGEDVTVIQILEDTIGLRPATADVTLVGEMALTTVGRELLGRTLSGVGAPLDGLPAAVGEARRPLWGAPINPTRRLKPSDFIETGVSAIDGMNTLVRGQKLPIFSGPGLPALDLAAQIVEHARAPREEPFAVVFAAIGITARETHGFVQRCERSGAIQRSILYLNQASDPTIERLLAPRVALTAAEFLAFDAGMHVLVVIADMTHYCEALREIATAREEIPGRRGYPGYLYTDLASIYERAGILSGGAGSLTQLPILTMPDDDITHPIPDLTGYITEGQVVLSRDLHRRGVFPPVDVLPSLSRLMHAGIGEGRTVPEHREWADQLYAIYAQGREARLMTAIVGESGLSSSDRRALAFAERFEQEFVNQGQRPRTIAATIAAGWTLLRSLPREELVRIRDATWGSGRAEAEAPGAPEGR